MILAPLALVAVAVVAAALMTTACWVAENGFLWHLVPDFSLAAPVAAPAVDLPAGPYYCEATRRWRDPVTKKFVARPAR